MSIYNKIYSKSYMFMFTALLLTGCYDHPRSQPLHAGPTTQVTAGIATNKLHAAQNQKKPLKISQTIKYTVYGKSYQVLPTSHNYHEVGLASWYGPRFQHRYTSSGERFNMFNMTAAHKTLPLSTYVLVTNLQNHRTVVVKINDRGPFVGKRIIDLSYGAAKKLGMVGLGVAPVSVTALPNPTARVS